MKAFKISMWILSVISVLIITVFLWCYFFVKKPQTVGVVNISTLSAKDGEDVPLEDATVFLEMNLMNNKNANGKTLGEFRFTSYMGTSEAYKEENASVYSYGYQLYDFDLNNLVEDVNYDDFNKVEILEKALGFIPLKNRYFYNCELKPDVYTYATSYLSDVAESVAVPYSPEESFIVSIKNDDGNYPLQLSLRDNCPSDINYFGKRSSYFNHLFNWNATDCYDYFTIDMNFLIYKLMFTLKSLEEGTHYFVLDLSDYFECRLYNEETKQFDVLTADKEYTWVTIKANIINDGVTIQNQSMFGMIADNDGSVTFETDSVSKFWKTVNNIILGVDNFRKRESQIEDGVYLYLNVNDIAELSKYKDNRIKIVLNLKSEDKILGFDSFALNGLKIYSCSISTNEQQEFDIMPNALTNSGISFEDIIVNNVTLVDLGGIYG